MKKLEFVIISFFCLISLNACAFDVLNIKQIPAQIESPEMTKGSFQLNAELKVDLGTGFSRTLKKGTKWDYVGTVPFGDVFKTNDQILTIEASNIYEAYIVVSASKLVGFYLPVERTFSPLSQPEDLIIKSVQ